jgi:hypothetical protein
MDYSLDGGTTWTAASATIAGGNYSLTIPGTSAGGVTRAKVRDHAGPTSIGTSNVFFIAASGLPTLPTISSPVFALDAYDARSGLYQDTSFQTQAAIGDTVQGVFDATSSGNNFAQATAANAPVLRASVKNNLPGLRFTGSLQQYLTQVAGGIGELLRQSTGYTILVVFTPATLPSAAAQDVMTLGQNTTGSDKVRTVQQLASGVPRTTRAADSAIITNLSAPSAISANTLAKCVSRWDGTNIKFAVNALSETSAAVSGVFNNAWPAGGVMGADISGTGPQFYLDGWIHEIRIWNSASSDTVRTNLLTYATSKWGS